MGRLKFKIKAFYDGKNFKQEFEWYDYLNDKNKYKSLYHLFARFKLRIRMFSGLNKLLESMFDFIVIATCPAYNEPIVFTA